MYDIDELIKQREQAAFQLSEDIAQLDKARADKERELALLHGELRAFYAIRNEKLVLVKEQEKPIESEEK